MAKSPLQSAEDDYDLLASNGGVDRAWYLERYPDVAAAKYDPVEHYLLYGWQEGRDPRADFSTAGYFSANKDADGNPLLHYLRHGGTPVPTEEGRFAADYRLAAGEGGVDQAWYLRRYRDVAAEKYDPVEHYLLYGWQEGRDPRPDFSTSGYLRANKGIDGNPLVHYLRGLSDVHSEDPTVTDWYLLWKTGFLYPKGARALSPSSALGSHGVPKILFTGHEASRTGAPLILLRLMEALEKLTGAELYLILESGGPLLQDYSRIAHVFVNQDERLYQSDGLNLARILRSIPGPAPNLAICNSAGGWRLARAVCEAGLPRIISLIHERAIYYPPDVWRSIHQNSDRVIFPAQAVKDAAIAVLPELRDACVVPQGLLNPEFGRRDRDAARIELRTRLGLSPDTKIILGCGTQDARKGLDLFVQLAARVRAQTSRDVHFIWLGAEHPGSPFGRLIELDISLLDLTSAISLLGEVTDPEPYYLAADAFALTSRDDPFPCVIHEAMACGLPIAVFDGSGGAKEAIADGCGIVVPYLDVEAMGRSLTSIIENPSQYAGMGQSAERRVRSIYRFTQYAERISRISESLQAERQDKAWGSESVAGLGPTYIGEDARAPSELNGLVAPSKWTRRPADVTARLKALSGHVARAIRAGQWWDFKLVPMFAVFYASIYAQQVSLASVWPAAITLLLAVAPCAAYVSLVNDLTDRADDQSAGKSNRMDGRPIWQMVAMLAGPLCAAVFFSVLWRDDILLVAAYLGSWAAFSLYSVPPFRLKSRGILGVVADACGSHVFPALTAALLAQRAVGHPIDPVWIGTLAVWTLGCGLRGILWHQLYDFEADRKAEVQTFVQRHSHRAAIELARAALLIELAGLAAVLWQIRSPWPLLLLLVYAVFATFQSRLLNTAIVIAQPSGRYLILGQEYYTLLFPFALLLASALQYPADWAVLVAHLIVFPRPTFWFIREARLVAERAAASLGSGKTPARHSTPPAYAASSHPNRRDERAMATPQATAAPALDVAIAKAASFLRERLRSGAYGLAAVGSDGTPRFPDDKGHIFVAWPIAEAMTGLLDEIDRTIILVRILSEEQDGVWGYQSPGLLYSDETRPFLVDSDDSAFAIRTLHCLGVNREPKCLMRFYREPERLFVTWDTPGPTTLTSESALQNNFRAHPEVNANIFLALRCSHFEKYANYEMLLHAQDQRGFWKSFFYPSPLYATQLVLDLTRGNPAFASATERALSFILESQNANGSWGADGDAYETALAVASLAGHQAHAAAIQRGVDYLLSTMAEDGSWRSRACVWESHWNEQDIWRGYDTHRAFTTARCLIALRRAAGQLVITL